MTAIGLRSTARVFLMSISMLCCPAYASDNQSVTIRYIAHASFVLTGPQGTRLLLDPYADQVWLGYDFPKNIQADAVFSTHPHYDHDGGLFIGHTPDWKDRMPLFKHPGRFTLGGFVIHGFKGRHAPPYGKEFGYQNTVFRFDVAGLSLLHIGDNEPLTATMARQLGNVDILMLPIDGKAHLLSFVAVDHYIKTLKPRIVIPMHYRIADLERDPQSPKRLGGIDPWLKLQSRVVRLGSNTMRISKHTLPASRQIWVFPHAPEVHAAQ